MGTDENKLREQLVKICERKTLVVGMGNTLKGDDGAGCVVCERLQDSLGGMVIDAGTVPENYIGPIIAKEPEVLLVVDAMDFGGAAGEVKIFKPEELSSAAISTHTLSPRLFVDVICKSIGAEVWFVGVQPGQTELGEGLSSQVKEAVDSLAGMIGEALGGDI